MPRWSVCSNTDSGYDSVKSQLCRACSSGKISRVHQGIYHKLRYSEILEDYVPCSAEEVACAIARNNGWHFIPSGNACLNNLGLSTQVPSKLVYYSDGPYRKYEINGIRVEFKHRSPRNLPFPLSARLPAFSGAKSWAWNLQGLSI